MRGINNSVDLEGLEALKVKFRETNVSRGLEVWMSKANNLVNSTIIRLFMARFWENGLLAFDP